MASSRKGGRLESSIEDDFVAWCAGKGYEAVKLQVKDWPDRLVALGGGVLVLVELKRSRGRLSPGQQILHRKLLKLGHDVIVPRSLEEAIEGIEKRVNQCRTNRRSRKS